MPSGRIDRIFGDIAQESRAFALSAPQTRLAACASLGAVGAVLLALSLDLEAPWWAGISAISILQGEAAATFTRAVERIVGTLFGAALGFLLSPLVARHPAFELACVGIVATSLYMQARSARPYVFLLGGVTAILVMFGTLEQPSNAFSLAINRSLEVSAGIVAGGLVAYVLHPVRTRSTRAGAGGTRRRSIDIDLLATAIVAGIGVALIPGIWQTLQLPGFSQTPITAFVAFTAIGGDARMKALTRLTGCFLGGVYGIAAVGIAADAMGPWLVLLAAGIFLAALIQHGAGDAAYAGHQAAVAIVLAMVSGPVASPLLTPALDRLAGIIGGIVIVAVTVVLLEPLRRYAMVAVMRQSG